MNLSIDLGNTRLKACLFEEGRPSRLYSLEYDQVALNLAYMVKEGILDQELKYIGVASVGKQEYLTHLEGLKTTFPDAVWLHIDHQTPIPLENAYATPETLGMDRLCAAIGAWSLNKKGPFLVVDAGTAITYEYVDRDLRYQGGAIAPGIRLRFKSLNEHTAALPLVETAPNWSLIGDSTETAIRSGVLSGLCFEINGYHQACEELAETSVAVFLTGGDAEFLNNHLKKINFVDPVLLHRGINAILEYNRADA